MEKENLFGKLLKVCLKELNLYHKNLIELMDLENSLGESIVSKWVNGVSKPKKEHYTEIVNALSKKIDEFTSREYMIFLDNLMTQCKKLIKDSDIPDNTKSRLCKMENAKILVCEALELAYYMENISSEQNHDETVEDNKPAIEISDNLLKGQFIKQAADTEIVSAETEENSYMDEKVEKVYISDQGKNNRQMVVFLNKANSHNTNDQIMEAENRPTSRMSNKFEKFSFLKKGSVLSSLGILLAFFVSMLIFGIHNSCFNDSNATKTETITYSANENSRSLSPLPSDHNNIQYSSIQQSSKDDKPVPTATPIMPTTPNMPYTPAPTALESNNKPNNCPSVNGNGNIISTGNNITVSIDK